MKESKKRRGGRQFDLDFSIDKSDSDFEDSEDDIPSQQDPEELHVSYEEYIASKNTPETVGLDCNSGVISNQCTEDYKKTNLNDIQVLLDEDLQSYSNETKFKNTKFECSVYKEVISKAILQQKYGDLYIEGQVSPRRFLILKELKPNSPFVLVNVLNNDILTTKILVSIVSPYLLSAQLSKICDFHEIIKAALFSVINVNIATKSFYQAFHDLQNTITGTHKFNLLINSGFYCPSNDNDDKLDEWQLINMIDGKPKSLAWDNFIECEICYEVKEVFSTLTKCGHYFCDECLKEFIQQNITNNNPMTCLNQNCKNGLDLVIICAFTSPIEFLRYSKIVCDIYLSTKKYLKFCPTPDCEYVGCTPSHTITDIHEDIRKLVFQFDLPLVDCPQCTNSWCYHCEKDKHWPATCEAYKLYLDQREKDTGVILHGNGMVITDTAYKDCKRCPSCKAVIFKDGGCTEMQCRCGASFCWTCCSYLESHEICKKVEYDNNILFIKSFTDFSDVLPLRMAMLYKSNQLENLKRFKTIAGKSTISKIQAVIEPMSQLLEASHRLIEMLYISQVSCSSEDQRNNLKVFIKSFKRQVQTLEGYFPTHPNLLPVGKSEINAAMEDVRRKVGELKSLLQ